MTHAKISERLYRDLKKFCPEQVERVMKAGSADIEPDFLGFVQIYYHLAKIIPKDYIVIDLGCAYAPQSYYFGKHRRYIGVDTNPIPRRFTMPNSENFVMPISEFLKLAKEKGYYEKEKVFAICSYVPSWGSDNIKLAKENFQNVFTYYPCKL